MEILVNGSEMKQCDKNTIEYFGVPSLVLMERAALGVVEEIKKAGADTSRSLIVCGLGNNGGDGLAAARLLHLEGSHVDVVMRLEEGKASEETRAQLHCVRQYGIKIWEEIPRENYTLVIDALFGIGLRRNLEGRYRDWVRQMNELSAFKTAVDIPSGVSADSGQILGTAFYADLTVTFAFRKRGLVLYPGAEAAGRIVVKQIGIDKRSWLDQKPSAYSLERQDLSRLPARLSYSNKGTYGKVLVAAGQKNMAGAACFCAMAAAVTGSGLVKILTAEENRIIIQTRLPEVILETYTQSEVQDGSLETMLLNAAAWAGVLVIGPGLGTGEAAYLQVKTVLEQAEIPVIADADALNLLAEYPQIWEKKKAPVIVTPHLGEMSRLCGLPVEAIQKDLVKTAVMFAEKYQVICVLKDARTVCALPDGGIYINQSGNNGMATAGAGDVLTGVLAGLTAQGMRPKEAAPLGVYLHGLAGDCMIEETGRYGLLATDIITGIKKIMMRSEKY